MRILGFTITRKQPREVTWTPERLRREARMFSASNVGSWTEWLELEDHEKEALANAGTAVTVERILAFIQAYGSEEGASRLHARVQGEDALEHSLLREASQMAAAAAKRGARVP